jgi:carboxylesterase|tara:strand:- start:91 stop:834 length:744 start_codon:yes stop_codon:yes gene_type:complete
MINNRFDSNDYEFNKTSPLGVYLIHGFTNTTYEIKELAEFLGNHGYHAIAKNLPGHGTDIQECNKVKYTDWLDQVKQDVAKLATESKKIYVIGCSMGAVIALYLSSIFPLNGCIVGGTVLKFQNSFTVNYIAPLFAPFVKTSKKPSFYDKKRKSYGYSSFPLLALNEMRKLIKLVKKNLENITIPTLIIHSNADKMSVKKNVDIIKSSIKSKDVKVFFVNHSHHNMFDENPDQKFIFNEVLQFLNSH